WVLTASRDAKARVRTSSLFGNREEEIPFNPVRLWDAETGKEVRGFAGQKYRIGFAAFSPDGRRGLAAEEGAYDHSTFMRAGGRMGGPSGSDGNAATAVRLYDTATGQELVTLGDRQGTITTAAFSPDGGRVLTASEQGGHEIGFRLWDATTGKELWRQKDNSPGATGMFRPDGRQVLTFSAKDVHLWDADTGKELARWPHDGGWSV